MSWFYNIEREKRPRLGMARLDERLGSRGKKYSREELIIAAEFKKAVNGDDGALARGLRRYADHLVAYLRNCKAPAKTVLLENFEPRKVDEALLLLGIASENPAGEVDIFFDELPPILLEGWATGAAFAKGEPTGSIQGYEKFCVPRPQQRVSARDIHD